jgi:lysozyme
MASIADYLDIGSDSKGSQGLSDSDIALGRKLLPYINAYEGKPEANHLVGYNEFDDYSDHPRTPIKFNGKGDKSTAAGLYQILEKTWDEQAKKQGLEDFTPANQEKAAIGIMRDTGVLDAYKSGDIAKTKQLLGKSWASIPGSTIGAATGQVPKLNQQAEALFGKAGPEVEEVSTQLSPWEKAIKESKNNKPAEPVDQTKQGLPSFEEYKNKFTKTMQGVKESNQALQPLADKAKQFVSGAASLADTTLGNVLPSTASYLTQGVARALPGVSAERAQELGGKVASAIDKPFGKALGVTNEPAYQQEASQRAMNFVGENIEKGADWISQKTGIPKPDVEHMMNSVMLAGGKVASDVAPKVLKPIAEKIYNIDEKISNIPESLKKAFPEMSMDEQGRFVKSNAAPAAATAAEPLKAMSAKGEVSGPKTSVAAPYSADTGFMENPYTERGLPAAERQSRLEVLNRTAPELAVDENVLSGLGKDRATDYAISQTDTPLGNMMAEQFAKEKAAQTAYANKLVEQTGGTPGLDESAVYKRGTTMLKPLEDLSTNLDKSIESLYKQRDAQAAGIPVIGEDIKKILSTESEVQGHEATVNLAKGASARLRELGMMDKEGNMLPSTAMQAEQFRQYLNRKWTNQNAPLNKLLKEAVDSDVFRNAGEDIHGAARELYTYKKNLLDNPKGIASILDSSGPEGINRKVPIEKIANTITNMPVDQLQHIITTLDSVPPELQASAQAAKNEIKAQFINRANAEFAKSANKGTTYLNENREVFSRVFTAEELEAINDMNKMAHILKTDTGYKGAAVQALNLAKKGVMSGTIAKTLAEIGAGSAGAGVGTFFGGPVGGVVGGLVGKEQMAKFMEGRELNSLVKAAAKKQKGFTNLNELTGKK